MDPADESLPFGIGQLPDELLLDIIHRVTPIRGFLSYQSSEQSRKKENRCRLSGLRSLTLTSQKLHLITHPILYQAFIQFHPSLRTHFFLRTILKKPSLASHIQYIETLRPIYSEGSRTTLTAEETCTIQGQS
ncbi:hypothetical protein CC78DRAFT_535112 [Lojkania enalia]|uniref:F-box domain-containing protein n=1 Tax=Lojkania enalia TaxID=147567 RepID=A0A9P4K698_9PLEO|nr:hypothetical protein CC78DRAFT_535112 [Didymosphaeria enalia]